jgi:hypothetical protein
MQLGEPPPVQFDLDTFSIAINNHALCIAMMASALYLFKNLWLTGKKRQVDGIGNGLAIKGKGMFEFTIKDDIGKLRTIKILNSL